MSLRDFGVTAPARTGTPPKQTWFAAASVIGAVLASSCCIAPLVLLTLGVSGAWIGNLTALEPYKPGFLGVALVFIGLGFRQVYFKPKPACEDGSYCARPESAIVTKTALWVATLLVVLAASIDWWAPLFY
ncbi:mercuric transporter MerT family protein [Cupriavidus metallidurans]|uniref:mercuric transporter MerT family protein n=1 Tax=Cupriavidus metallidurans TaxID=119219 RepID=UPI0035C70BA2